MRVATHNALLGISLDERRLNLALVSRAGAGVEVKSTHRFDLALDPLIDGPELVGREIRNHLDEAGIKETRCVVCVPLKWVMSLHVSLPELPEADIASFLELQAERDFPFPAHDLSLYHSRYETPEGAKYANIVAIRTSHAASLEQVMKAAGLRLVSVTLAITSLQPPAEDEAQVSLLLAENSIDLQIGAGGGAAVLRSLNEALINEPDGKAIDSELIARQLRISLGQLPRSLRESLREMLVFGPEDVQLQVTRELRDPAAKMGLSLDTEGLDAVESDGGAITGAVAAASNLILGRDTGFEFLPPRVSRFRRMADRVSARGTLWLAGTVAAVLLIAGLAFTFQWRQLSSLESKWNAIRKDVEAAEDLQSKIRGFYPWFDDTAQSLTIIKRLTESFPEDGDLWAKSVQIEHVKAKRGTQESVQVNCSVNARSSRDRFAVIESLREAKEVAGLQSGQVRGDNPEQFSFEFTWNGGGPGGV